MNFDWNNAKAFLYTAESGSLSAAAKKLASSQPTVGRQVAALEASLNTPLFERMSNKLLLTPKGKIIYDNLKEMQAIAERTSLKAESLSDSLSGEVSLAVNQLDAIYLIPPLIQEFHLEHPNIQIKVKVSNQTSDLLAREADIALRNVRPSEDNLIARKLSQEPVYFYCSKDNIAAFDTIKNNPKNLTNMEIIGFEDFPGVIAFLSNHGWEVNKDNIKIASNFQPFHIEIAKRSNALVMLPQSAGDRIPELERLSKEEDAIFQDELWLVCHQELRHSKKIRYFFDFLASKLGN